MNEWISKLGEFLCQSTWGEKLLMCANILLHDWRITSPFSHIDAFDSNAIHQVDAVYGEFSPDSIDTIKNFLQYAGVFGNRDFQRSFFYNYHHLYPKELLQADREVMKQLKKLRRKTKLSAGAESLVYHHGLARMPAYVLDYIKNRIFIDAGAFEGDSTLVFSQYHPQKVIAFEPSRKNQNAFLKTMAYNKVPKSIYKLLPFGLDEKEGIIHFSDTGGGENNLQNAGNCVAQVFPLDTLVKKHQWDVGLIKADLEGMGLRMLRGAEETIKKCRPFLTLSIYHNAEEMFGMAPLLKEWLPDYHFFVCNLSNPCNRGEITLIGIPCEVGLHILFL